MHVGADPTTATYVQDIATTVNDGQYTWEMPQSFSGYSLPDNFRIDIVDGSSTITGTPFRIFPQSTSNDVYSYGSTQSHLNIYNHGNAIRIARGTVGQPQVYQHINRNFFYTSPSASIYSFNNYHLGLPPAYPTTFEIVSDNTYTKLNTGGGQLPFATTNKTLYYKFSAVFDGNQELPLNSNYKAFFITGVDPASANTQIRLKLDTDDWDPRITSLNMYRAITDAEVPDDALYQKINTFETTMSTTTNWINGTAQSLSLIHI